MDNPIGHNTHNTYRQVPPENDAKQNLLDSLDDNGLDGMHNLEIAAAGQYSNVYRPKISSYAIVSLVLGIFGSYGITAIISIILGLKARKDIACNPGQSGDGLALSGILISVVHLGLLVMKVICVWLVLPIGL